MYKQAIMRHLSRQDVANLLMTYVYGGVETSEVNKEAVASKRMNQATIAMDGDLLLVKGNDQESCDWVDRMIQLDNEKGVEIKGAIEAKVTEARKAQEEQAAQTQRKIEDDAWAEKLEPTEPEGK